MDVICYCIYLTYEEMFMVKRTLKEWHYTSFICNASDVYFN